MAADVLSYLPGPGAASIGGPEKMSPPRRAGDNEAFSFWGVRLPVSGVVRVAEAVGRVGVPGIVLLGMMGMAGAAGVRYGDPLLEASIERDRAMTLALSRLAEIQPEKLKLLQLIHDDSIRTQTMLADVLAELKEKK